MKRLIPILLALSVLAGCERPARPVTVETPNPSPHEVSRETQQQPETVWLPDCRSDKTPCASKDGSGWQIVHSRDPYSYVTLPRCDVEDYPTNTPCVWDKPKDARWLVIYYREG